MRDHPVVSQTCNQLIRGNKLNIRLNGRFGSSRTQRSKNVLFNWYGFCSRTKDKQVRFLALLVKLADIWSGIDDAEKFAGWNELVAFDGLVLNKIMKLEQNYVSVLRTSCKFFKTCNIYLKAAKMNLQLVRSLTKNQAIILEMLALWTWIHCYQHNNCKTSIKNFSHQT